MSAPRKRKANTKDSASSDHAAVYDELGTRPLAHILSQSDSDSDLDGSAGPGLNGGDSSSDWSLSDDEGAISDAAGGDDADELDTDEIPDEADDAEDQSEDGDLDQSHGLKGFSLSQRLNAHAQGETADDVASAPGVTTDANGNLRYVYPEIDPVYDSDDSDAPPETARNTIGNIPLSFYDAYPHIGYDIDGKRVMRPAKGQALDSLLDSIEIPKGWTGLTDPATGKPLELSEEELDVLKRLTRNEIPEDGYDPYPEMVEYFTSRTEQMPLSAAPEPKRRFVPSKHEAKRVMKIVKAIKEGRIQPYRPPTEGEEDDSNVKTYDIWADEAPRPDHPMNVPAPKLPPPGYDESYHPPPEYLPDEDERKAWQETDEEDKQKEYLPANYDALRKVPGYERFIKEKFERCLDLYLAPRVRRSKLDIDPESLLPKLPSPEELKPFPSRCDLVFRGHEGRVRSVAIDPHGNTVASGGDDGRVRIWDLRTGRQLWHVQLSKQEAVNVVRWRPLKDSLILSAAAGDTIYLIAPPLPSVGGLDSVGMQASRDLLSAGWTASNGTSDSAAKDPPGKWARPETRLQDQGVIVQVTVRATVKVISWHRRGEYFATVCPQGQTAAVAIHTLSKHLTQLPFRRLKGLAQSVQFHPSKPVLFVATQRMVRSYDLAAQELLKVLQPGARWISSFDVHPGGDNMLVGSYDRRLLWMDMDLSARPYKTLRYHAKAIRSVRFHAGGYPLFADASDDGSIQVFHGKVHGDMMENASVVPLKVLRGHGVEQGLGVLELDWHPTEPCCVSAGADGTCRSWRP